MQGFFRLEETVPYFREHPQARSRYVGLVACGKRKRPISSPARRMYVGGFSRACFSWIERNCKVWRILSAKYGVLDPKTKIDTYELSLHSMSPDNKDSWGIRVTTQLQQEFPLGTQFLCLAGSDYRDYLDLPNLIVVFANLPARGLGAQIQWLKNNPILTDEVLYKIETGKLE